MRAISSTNSTSTDRPAGSARWRCRPGTGAVISAEYCIPIGIALVMKKPRIEAAAKSPGRSRPTSATPGQAPATVRARSRNGTRRCSRSDSEESTTAPIAPPSRSSAPRVPASAEEKPAWPDDLLHPGRDAVEDPHAHEGDREEHHERPHLQRVPDADKHQGPGRSASASAGVGGPVPGHQHEDDPGGERAHAVHQLDRRDRHRRTSAGVNGHPDPDPTRLDSVIRLTAVA